jgi:histone-lysine N-methyltransferase SETMAR
VVFVERDATVCSERYVQTLNNLTQGIRRVRPNRKMIQVLQLHVNGKPHTILSTREATATVGRTVLSHPPYSSELAPSDFHLFGPLKDAVRGRRFADDNELKHDVSEELRRFSSFTLPALSVSRKSLIRHAMDV